MEPDIRVQAHLQSSRYGRQHPHIHRHVGCVLLSLLLLALLAACGEADGPTGNDADTSATTTPTAVDASPSASASASPTVPLPTSDATGTSTPTAADVSYLDLPTQVPTDAHHDALLQGTLVRNGDCLFILASDGPMAHMYPVLWPHGYRLRISGDRADLLDADGAVRASVGDRVALGGGQGGPPLATPEAAAACVQSDTVWYAASVEAVANVGTATPTPAGHLPLPTQLPQAAFPAARIEGTLVMEDGCLYLDNVLGEPGERWGVVWQFGWSVREVGGEQRVVDEHGAVRAEIGSDIALGGGTWNDPDAADQPCLQPANVWYASPEVIALEAPIPPRTLPLELPTQTVAQDMDSVVEGILRPSIGCVVVMSATQTYVIIWPPGYDLQHDGERSVVVDASDATQAYLWDTVRIGGGEGVPPPGMESDPCLSVPAVWYADGITVIESAE